MVPASFTPEPKKQERGQTWLVLVLLSAPMPNARKANIRHAHRGALVPCTPPRPRRAAAPPSPGCAGVHPHPKRCASFGLTREKFCISLYTL